MWEWESLELAVFLYSYRKGEWVGKRESDDIWPINLKKPYKRPWSDYQFEVFEDLRKKLREFELKAAERATLLIPR